MSCGAERIEHHYFDTICIGLSTSPAEESISTMISSGSFSNLVLAIIGFGGDWNQK